MRSLKINLDETIDRYIDLEIEIQKLIHPVVNPFCSQCRGACCKEEICKESIESSFLSLLTQKQAVHYDTQSGWLGPSGCRLAFGRPLVCYEFFCDEVLKSTVYKTAGVQAIIKDFVAIGKNAYGQTHLICVEDLDRLSVGKIDKMDATIRSLFERTTKKRSLSGA